MNTPPETALDDAALRRLIQPAAELALDYARRRERLGVDLKSPGQFVSEADRAVEVAIRAALAEAFGPVPILGEEAGGGLDADGSGWAIDPIDGTTNFLRGLPLWGVSAGLMARGAPIAGIVVLPELGLTLTAQHGRGTVVNGVALPAGVGSAVGLIALGENGFEPGASTDARAERYRGRCYTVVRYNCAVFSLANVALGRLDGYVENGCSLWDIAAAWLICQEAGVAVDVRRRSDGQYSIVALQKDVLNLSF